MTLRLSNKQWSLIKDLTSKRSLETRGRKRKDDKSVFEICLDMFIHGYMKHYSWRSYNYYNKPSFQTCNRRFNEWNHYNVFTDALEILAKDLEERGGVPLKECFHDEWYEGGCYLVINYDFISNIEDQNWIIRTKDFFESNNVWTMLNLLKSEWIQSRLPSDLEKRI